MSGIYDESYDRLSDKGDFSEYDFCNNVLSAESLNTCSDNNSNLVNDSAADDSATVGQDPNGGDVQAANEQSESAGTKDFAEVEKLIKTIPSVSVDDDLKIVTETNAAVILPDSSE
eukprot:Tbor_TRINITY_DN5899_c3_g3::TRINITY_DN5899_c3_g3_i1::g.6567::m.6567